METKKWVIAQESGMSAPMGTASVQELLRSRQITMLHFAVAVGGEKWQRLVEFQEFSSFIPQPPSFAVPAGGAPNRKHKRAPIRGTLKPEGEDWYELVNISEGGALVKSPALLPIGSTHQGHIESQAFPQGLKIAFRVVHHAQLPTFTGFGIEFVDLPAECRAQIQEHVDKEGPK